jgi:3D (Asp-Asp-Asp) domain-containing protein
MKRLLAFTVLLHLTVPAAFAWNLSPFKKSKREQPMLARVTVYWASGGSGSDWSTRHHKCATGLRLQTGHCAVDPERIPYGSRVIFPDGTTLAAVDTGTAVKNRKAARNSGHTVFERNAIVIDRFFETKRQALTWATNNPLFMMVRVLPPDQRYAPQVPAASSGMVFNNRAPANSSGSKPTLLVNRSSISRSPFNKLSR